MTGHTSNPSRAVIARFLETALPGRSAAIRRLRDELLDFAISPSHGRCFFAVPIGAGKSTVAHLIALLKRVAPSRQMKRKPFLMA